MTRAHVPLLLGKDGSRPRPRPRLRPLTRLLAILVLVLSQAQGQETQGPDEPASRLGLADLATYRAALAGRAAAVVQGDPRPVSFRDLWDHPDAWRGRRVTIRGRPVRTFRQPAFGEFPPLVETWLSTPRGNLFCTVHPQADTADVPAPAGSEVRFTGTFLRTIRYPAADTARLAPLVVGDQPPTVADDGRNSPAAAENPAPGGATQGPALWPLGAAALLLAALGVVLAWYHLHTPARLRPPARLPAESRDEPSDPPLEFLDPEA